MVHSILIIGQSNMAGRGVIEQAPPLKNKSRLFVARNCKWVNLFRPVNPDRSFSGVCLAETFADLYAEDHDVSVGIIPCADGGTTLEQWMPNGVLFENAVNCAKLCQRDSTLVAILWHQGESDSTSEQLKQVYAEKLKILFDELRARLGKDIPIVIGELGEYLKDHGKFPFFEDINKALKSYAENTDNVAFASAKGLKDKGDILHFDTPSLIEFGTRYYNAFKTIENVELTKNVSDHTISISEIEKL